MGRGEGHGRRSLGGPHLVLAGAKEGLDLRRWREGGERRRAWEHQRERRAGPSAKEKIREDADKGEDEAGDRRGRRREWNPLPDLRRTSFRRRSGGARGEVEGRRRPLEEEMERRCWQGVRVRAEKCLLRRIWAEVCLVDSGFDSLGKEKLAVLPAPRVGFAQMPLSFWASPVCQRQPSLSR